MFLYAIYFLKIHKASSYNCCIDPDQDDGKFQFQFVVTVTKSVPGLTVTIGKQEKNHMNNNIILAKIM